MAKKTNVPLKRRRRSELNVKLIAIIAAVLFVVTIGIVSAVIGSHKKENNPSVADNQNNETTAEPTTEEETTTKVPTIEVDLMMIGDMLMHEGVVKSGLMDDGTYNFDHLYTNIAKDISSADIRIVNQETILGGSDFAYTGYPTFNSPWALGDAEVKAGFNIILHATNHTLDKGLKGVENCLSFWKTYHPDTTVLGINETEEDYENIYVYEKEGFKIAFLNYTYGTNGIPIPDSKPYIVNMLDKDKITADVTKAKQLADMVIVLPHWGTEYVYTPDSNQNYWTQLFLSLGVDVVIVHILMSLSPLEVVSDTKGHEMLVYYSLGNFVSNQDQKPRMIGGMAKMTLVKDETGCYVKNYNLTPVITQKLFGKKAITTYKLSDYTESLASGNAIRNDSGCSDFSLSYCQTLVKQILGDDYDESTSELNVSLHPDGLVKDTSATESSSSAK
ncbi:MAG: CapA family protein [Lachnospira eligens]